MSKKLRPEIVKAPKDLVELMIELNQKIEKQQNALKNIYHNTLYQEPSVYRSGILANIEKAVGKEKYKEWEEYYK